MRCLNLVYPGDTFHRSHSKIMFHTLSITQHFIHESTCADVTVSNLYLSYIAALQAHFPFYSKGQG